jgi:hypothetical protein
MSDFGSIQASRALVELVEDLQKAPEDTTFLGFLSHGSTPKSSICLGDFHGFSIINLPFGGSNIFETKKLKNQHEQRLNHQFLWVIQLHLHP